MVIRAKDVLAGLPVGPRGAHADLWKSLQRAAEGRTIGVRWVPSHRSKEAVVRGIISEEDRIGNAGADEKATEALAHQPDADERRAVIVDVDRVVSGVLQLAAMVFDEVIKDRIQDASLPVKARRRKRRLWRGRLGSRG